MLRFPWIWIDRGLLMCLPIMSWPAYQRWRERRAWRRMLRAANETASAIKDCGAAAQEASDTFSEFGALILAQAEEA